jgi:hypothetical protein
MDQEMPPAPDAGTSLKHFWYYLTRFLYGLDAGFQTTLGRGCRKKHTDRLVASVQADLEDEDGVRLPEKTRKCARPPRSAAIGNRFDPLTVDEEGDSEDDEFEKSSSSDDSSSESDGELSNGEV